MLHRIFNFTFAIIGLVLLSPVFALLAIAIKLDDGGPVFFRGRRIGRNGSEFRLLKFRSMRVGADKAGSGITKHGDERITAVGKILRRTKLDELPQLWNVVLGQMNLVGPRPEDPRYVAIYSEAQSEILRFRPGMTSPASVCYRNEEQLLNGPQSEQYYIDRLLPRKIELDLDYCRHQSILSDIALIFRTFAALPTK